MQLPVLWTVLAVLAADSDDKNQLPDHTYRQIRDMYIDELGMLPTEASVQP